MRLVFSLGNRNQLYPVYSGLLSATKARKVTWLTWHPTTALTQWLCRNREFTQVRVLENMEKKRMRVRTSLQSQLNRNGVLKSRWCNPWPFAICWMLPLPMKIFPYISLQECLGESEAVFGDEPTLSEERKEAHNFLWRNADACRAEDHWGTQM